MKTILIIIFAGTSIISTTALAASYNMWTTSILTVYAQSMGESTAHLIKVEDHMLNGGLHPTCGNRAYILPTDTQLYSTALAISLSGKKVNIGYEDAAVKKLAAGHTESSCKVKSIWWN